MSSCVAEIGKAFRNGPMALHPSKAHNRPGRVKEDKDLSISMETRDC